MSEKEEMDRQTFESCLNYVFKMGENAQSDPINKRSFARAFEQEQARLLGWYDTLLPRLEAAEKAVANWREVHCDEIITERVVVFSALREALEVIDLLADKLADVFRMDYLTRRTTDKARKSIRDALKMQDTSKPEAQDAADD